jgi:protein gp37
MAKQKSSGISYCDETWNPIVGCTHVSEGCRSCWAEKEARLHYHSEFPNGWDGHVRVFPERLEWPLHRRKPIRIAVGLMGDWCHSNVPVEFRDRIMAIATLCPQHTFIFLTKRADEMWQYYSDPKTPFRIAKAMDCIEVEQEIAAMGPEEIRAIKEYPGYYVSDRGRILSSSGSSRCLFCGKEVLGIATKQYCSKKCRQNACFYRRTGRPREGERFLQEMSPDAGEQGHMRVMFYRDGKTWRELVHRLVLSAFVREPIGDEQACHRNGDARINALPNLRWGSYEDNWADRIRHGNGQSHSKISIEQVNAIRKRHGDGETAESLAREFCISPTQIRNIAYGDQWNIAPAIIWPLLNCHLGVSCENQAAADERIPFLLQTPAAVRFVSLEPLLSSVNLKPWINRCFCGHDANFAPPWLHNNPTDHKAMLDWVIVGGESGLGARAMHLDWVRSIRDQCQSAAVPFYFKQWGEWAPCGPIRPDPDFLGGECFDAASGGTVAAARLVTASSGYYYKFQDGQVMERVGKKSAGRILDGREWLELPKANEPL